MAAQGPPGAHPPEDIGNCVFFTNIRKEEICNDPGYREIVVKNEFGYFAAVICRGHDRAVRAFYRTRRGNSPRQSGS